MSSNAPVPSEEVLSELQRLLSSPAFEASERNRRFLRHVVEETLAGRADRIKAYSIATGVFGRGVDFDPQQDSIVRIEAARLRRALEHCYLKEETTGNIRIFIPKGTYVPEFEVRGQDRVGPAPDGETPVPTRPLHEFGPRVLVENFDQEGDLELCPTIGRTLTRQVISALTRFTDLFVYGFDTTEDLSEADRRSSRAGKLMIDYCLSGTVTISKETLRAELLMRRAEDGRFVWVHNAVRELGREPDPSRIASLCGEIAGHVSRVIALRDGIMDSQAREFAGESPIHFAGYQKLLEFHDYWRSLDPTRFEPLRQDLETTIASDPHFAAAHACLSMLYSNAARYGYDVGADCASPLERALELARKAIHLAPSSSRAYHARAIAEWFSGRPEESLRTLQIALSLNPNDPELLAELGFRKAMRMEWESAVPLLEEAYARNPLQTGQYRMGLFLYHFAEGRHEKALQEIRAIDAPGIAYVHLASAASLSELGQLGEARACLDEAERLAPGLRLKLRDDLAFRQLHPALIAIITRAVGRVDPNWALSIRTNRLDDL
jgi:tetratricopeptide (TPR) repeat protein